MGGRRAGLCLALVIVVVVGSSVTLQGVDPKPSVPSPKEKCPVCGMFVGKYPDWLAQIVFKDGAAFFFDGPKDMFKFYHNLNRYSPKRKIEDVVAVYVTDYYGLFPIDGFRAFYVLGSDIYGPMGRELIPFLKSNEALEFKKDHKGKEILTFRDITPVVIKGLD